MRPRTYRCPGCDREAHVYVSRTTLHAFGNNGLVYSISCQRSEDELPNQCLGQWFAIRPFQSETSAISEWNNAIIDMAASALGITRRQALDIKEHRILLTDKERG